MSAPFAERGKLGFVRAYLETWKMATLEPGKFFRQVKVNETSSAVLFAVIAGTLAGWASTLISLMFVGRSMDALIKYFSFLPPETVEQVLSMSRGSILSSLLLAPLQAVVWVFVGAGIYHLFLLLVGAAERGFGATITAVCYSYGVMIFTVVPLIGSVVALVWYLVLVIIGFSETQRCGLGKASFAALAPVFLACCCAVAVSAYVVSAFHSFHM